MNIVVLIKQVPDNTKLKADQVAGNTLPEDGVPMMMNPYDEYALETALRLKEAAGDGAIVTAISLGAASAKEILKKALAAGADQAFLLSDSSFSGGDSISTANALAAGIKTLTPDYRLVVAGQMSLDNAAAQTGPMVAELLDAPSLTFGKNAELAGETLKVSRETEQGVETHDMSLPGVICMMKCDYELRTANIKGVMKANKTEIPLKTAADLGLAATDIGKDGAKTEIQKIWQRPEKSGGTVIDGADANTAVAQLVEQLKTAKVV
ncbi:MAG: electron transfer flavoprotein subunit beta/FixA family protein [Vampirovibrio sp.]|nr:electron transfer flavoprotein subunit beta/FixA family protein [Vampirovibrio sp.]